MQQRVALVRALALGAPLLAMDEPLAALDEITRSEMRGLINQLVEGRGVTTFFVTHSIGEAVALSDRVLVTSPRPARIIADIAIDLARPRPDDVDDEPRFFELCSHVRHALLEGGTCDTRRHAIVAPIAGLVVFFGAWELLVRVFDIRPFVLARPSRIVRYLARFPDDYFHASLMTMKHAALGFAFAIVVAC